MDGRDMETLQPCKCEQNVELKNFYIKYSADCNMFASTILPRADILKKYYWKDNYSAPDITIHCVISTHTYFGY